MGYAKITQHWIYVICNTDLLTGWVYLKTHVHFNVKKSAIWTASTVNNTKEHDSVRPPVSHVGCKLLQREGETVQFDCHLFQLLVGGDRLFTLTIKSVKVSQGRNKHSEGNRRASSGNDKRMMKINKIHFKNGTVCLCQKEMFQGRNYRGCRRCGCTWARGSWGPVDIFTSM